MRSAVRIRERESGHLAGGQDVPVAEGLGERVLRLEGALDVDAYA